MLKFKYNILSDLEIFMYDKMKFCWKQGYRLDKIKEYMNISDESFLLELFRSVIEKELKITCLNAKI